MSQKIEPKGNGDAKSDSQVDLRSLLHPRRADEKKGVVDSFLSSDKNNPTKSRIPSPPGMAVYQALGLWASTKSAFVYDVKGEKGKIYPRTVAGLHQLFKDLYDEDAISHKGQSRGEAQTVALGYLLQDAESFETLRKDRVGEKGGAAKSK